MSTYKTKPSDLMKVWSLSKSSDLRQLTLRIPSDTFFKIQALEILYRDRSRNELISDLLTTAIDEFEEGLPYEAHEGELVGHGSNGEPFYDSWETGQRQDFRRLVETLKELPKSELKVVDGNLEGDAA